LLASQQESGTGIVVALLKARAKLEITDAKERTAILVAFSNTKNPELYPLLRAAGARLDVRDNDGNTLALEALNQGWLFSEIQELVKAGSRLD
jgi:hypothetical protein